MIHTLLQQLINTPWYEYLAVFTGILSVWYSKQENILVYPVGLISTFIYIYLCIAGRLFGEASVNIYYTVMSMTGWYLWLTKNKKTNDTLHISFSTKKELQFQFLFFISLYIVLYYILKVLKQYFVGAIPTPDALATASAYTGMYLMVRKKVECWYWWMVTNIVSIPLFYYKGYIVTSIYYIILLLLAVYGLQGWRQKAIVKHVHL